MHLTSSLVRPRLWATFAFFSLFAAFLSACATRAPKVYVPHQPTAQLQYAYANNYRAQKNIVLRDTTDSVRWAETRKALEMAYEMVIELYPEDLVYTPIAKLEIAEIRAGLDFSAPDVTSPRDLREAIRMLQALQEDYPQIHYIRAKAMLDEALAWKALRKFDKVQSLLVELMDNYRSFQEPEIVLILNTAQSNYQQVYVD